MSDLFDYLAWRGDIPMSQAPFNPVDGLILSILSYVHFDNLVPPDLRGPISLGRRRKPIWPCQRGGEAVSDAFGPKAAGRSGPMPPLFSPWDWPSLRTALFPGGGDAVRRLAVLLEDAPAFFPSGAPTPP